MSEIINKASVDYHNAAADYALRNSGVNCERISELSFKAGAEWQQEQYKPLIDALQAIANWPGNLPDEQYLSATGANDAAYRGGLVVAMRSFAVEALKKIDL